MKGLILVVLAVLINCGSNPSIRYCNLLQYNHLTPLSISNIHNFESEDFEIHFKAISNTGDTVIGKISDGIIVQSN